MPNVVVVVKDDRVRRQIEQYLTELDMADLRFATFKRFEEFEELYYKDRSAPAAEAPPDGQAPAEAKPEESPPPAEEDDDLKLFSEIHLVLFALDSVGHKSSAWIARVLANLKRYRYMPTEGSVRMVLFKYEDDGISKLDLIHPALDDLIYLPLDRLIFLQKMEIILTLPKIASPKFLFNQEVKHPIEISKIVKLDRLSDVAMAIRNPVPLKHGVPGKFYLQLPGEKDRLELRGKVLQVEPHPEAPNQSLVYFGYFGLIKTGLSALRRALAKAPLYLSLKNQDRELVRHKPNDLFGTPETDRIFSIAMIDTDEVSNNSLAQHLVKEMDRLSIVTESSYSLFLYKYLGAGGTPTKESPPKPTVESDLPASTFSLSVTVKEMKCLSVDPGPKEGDLFLGHPAQTIFGTPEKWLELFQDKESKLILEESLVLAAQGRVLEKLMIMRDSENHRRATIFKFYRTASEEIVNIDVKPAGLDDIMAKMTSEATNKVLDVMIVDTSFVPDDPIPWIEGLRLQAMQQNLIKRPEDLKIMLMADPDRKQSELWLKCPDILGLFIKPVDSRQLLVFLSEHLQNNNTLFTFSNLGFSSPALTVHVAKDVQLEALSEFGATLHSPSKLAPGTIFYLRKSIYDNAPNGCLAARVYACEDHADGGYQVFTTYFGINDAFLKYARTWIRENYAHQKNQES